MGTGPPLSGMSWAHPFGVDQLGRDMFSRVVHGGHIVILLSLSGTALGLVVGAVVGLLSGYVGGWVDEILQRLLEALISIPFLVLALMAIAAAGPELSGNPVLIVLVVALVYAPAHRPHGARGGDRHRRRAISSRWRGCAARAPGRSCGASCCPTPPACCWSSSRCAPAMRRC